MPSDRLTGFSSAFDELLERSRRELDALSGGSGAPALDPTPRTPSSPNVGSSAAATRRVTQSASTRAPAPAPASRSPAERALDDKLGTGWRFEVLERNREGDELVVRCRVTAPARGVSRTWYGSAPISGDGRRGASGLSGRAGSVRFSLGAGVGAGVGAGAATFDPIQTEREVERQAIESALAACARLL